MRKDMQSTRKTMTKRNNTTKNMLASGVTGVTLAFVSVRCSQTSGTESGRHLCQRRLNINVPIIEIFDLTVVNHRLQLH